MSTLQQDKNANVEKVIANVFQALYSYFDTRPKQEQANLKDLGIFAEYMDEIRVALEEMQKKISVQHARSHAVAMATHKRLSSQSQMQNVPPEILDNIIMISRRGGRV
eukprot:2231626-Rhodomonas_salina.1